MSNQDESQLAAKQTSYRTTTREALKRVLGDFTAMGDLAERLRGEIERFFDRYQDAMMEEAAVVAALDTFAFDGRGYSVATANRMREALSAASGTAGTALLDTQPVERNGK